MSTQQDFGLTLPPQHGTTRTANGWLFQLNAREVMLLRKSITMTGGGWQSAIRAARASVTDDGQWFVSTALMLRLFRMCTRQGPHGGYQSRLPMRVLAPVFAAAPEDWTP